MSRANEVALKVHDMTMAMPIHFSTPVELGVLRGPTRSPLMARGNRTILVDNPTRPMSISDLRRHTAEAESPVRSRFPQASPDLPVRGGNEAFLGRGQEAGSPSLEDGRAQLLDLPAAEVAASRAPTSRETSWLSWSGSAAASGSARSLISTAASRASCSMHDGHCENRATEGRLLLARPGRVQPGTEA